MTLQSKEKPTIVRTERGLTISGTRITLYDIMVSSDRSPQQILICQNRTCRKQGSAKVLAAFKEYSMDPANVRSSGCLGRCGSGPMVVVLPQEVWYGGVRVEEVPAIVERHRDRVQLP